MDPCSKCGQPHVSQFGGPACASHVVKDRETGERLTQPRPCTHAPMKGQRVCYHHGGAKRSARAAGERRHAVQVIEAETAALLAAEGLEGVDDPIAEIGRLAVEALALKRAAGARANSLDEIRYTGGLQRDERGELIGTGTEQLRAEVALYERALDRSMKFLEVVAKHTSGRDADKVKGMLAALWDSMRDAG